MSKKVRNKFYLSEINALVNQVIKVIEVMFKVIEQEKDLSLKRKIIKKYLEKNLIRIT